MVDPVTGGFTGWVCGKLADKVLGNLMKSRELNHEIEKVVNKWTKSLNGDRYVDADVLFAAVELSEDGEERKYYLALQAKLLKCQWPDQGIGGGTTPGYGRNTSKIRNCGCYGL